MNYRSDIDGLRAIAILFVLFFHGGLTLFPSGLLELMFSLSFQAFSLQVSLKNLCKIIVFLLWTFTAGDYGDYSLFLFV